MCLGKPFPFLLHRLFSDTLPHASPAGFAKSGDVLGGFEDAFASRRLQDLEALTDFSYIVVQRVSHG